MREIEFLAEVRCSLLSDRRKIAPYGLAGGKPGKNELILPNGKKQALPSKYTFTAPKGSILRIETPGGGGWGK